MICYDVIAEDCKVFDADNAIHVWLVFLFDLGQNGHLGVSLLHDVLTFLYYFQGQMFFGLVIEYLDDFAKGSLVNRFDYLIAIGNMIADLIFVELVVFRLELFLIFSTSHFGYLIIVRYFFDIPIFLHIFRVSGSRAQWLDSFALVRPANFAILDLSKEVDPFVLSYLVDFFLRQALSILFHHFFPIRCELLMVVASSLCVWLEFLALWLVGLCPIAGNCVFLTWNLVPALTTMLHFCLLCAWLVSQHFIAAFPIGLIASFIGALISIDFILFLVLPWVCLLIFWTKPLLFLVKLLRVLLDLYFFEFDLPVELGRHRNRGRICRCILILIAVVMYIDAVLLHVAAWDGMYRLKEKERWCV